MYAPSPLRVGPCGCYSHRLGHDVLVDEDSRVVCHSFPSPIDSQSLPRLLAGDLQIRPLFDVGSDIIFLFLSSDLHWLHTRSPDDVPAGSAQSCSCSSRS